MFDAKSANQQQSLLPNGQQQTNFLRNSQNANPLPQSHLQNQNTFGQVRNSYVQPNANTNILGQQILNSNPSLPNVLNFSQGPQSGRRGRSPVLQQQANGILNSMSYSNSATPQKLSKQSSWIQKPQNQMLINQNPYQGSAKDNKIQYEGVAWPSQNQQILNFDFNSSHKPRSRQQRLQQNHSQDLASRNDSEMRNYQNAPIQNPNQNQIQQDGVTWPSQNMNFDQNPYQNSPQKGYTSQQPGNMGQPQPSHLIKTGQVSQQRNDLHGSRKKEKLFNDLIQIHGEQQYENIRNAVEQVDPRAITGLNDQDYQQFVNAFSGKIYGNNTQSPYMNNLQESIQSNTNKQLLKSQSQGKSLNKRHLPIAQKQMVYNEWGAILQHQDEIDRALKQQERQENQEFKSRYRNELEQQRQDVAKKIEEDKLHDAQMAQSMLEYQKAQDLAKAQNEDAKRLRLKEQIIAKQKESQAEKEFAMKYARDQAASQQEQYKQQALQALAQQNEEERIRKQNFRQQAQNYSQDLNRQKIHKMNEARLLKEKDKEFAAQEMEKQVEADVGRQQFFSKMQGYQDANDRKAEAFSNFMAGKDIATLSKLDEERYMNAIAQKNAKDEKDAERKRLNILNARNYNKDVLLRQMEEKQLQKIIQRQSDESFARQILHQVKEGDVRDKQQKDRIKQQNRAYVENLKGQIVEGSEKKRYGQLMTEHERKVNDRDIRAYEDHDNVNIYGKLPGFGGLRDAQRQKQIVQRALAGGSPAQFSKKADVYISPQGPGNVAQNQQVGNISNPVPGQRNQEAQSQSPQMGLAQNKARAQKSQILLGGQSVMQQGPSFDRNSLKQVRKNMQRPEAFKFRGNTGNTGYGYDQVHDDTPPGSDSDRSQGSYRFAAAGNRGSLVDMRNRRSNAGGSPNLPYQQKYNRLQLA